MLQVEEFHEAFKQERGVEFIKQRCKKIVKDFCTSDSVMEVNLDEKTRKKIVQDSEEPTLGMFDSALSMIDRDIARSLQAFFVTEIFLSYYEHREIIDDLLLHESKTKMKINAAVRDRSETIGHSESSAEVMQSVRNAFNSKEAIFLRRHFDVSSAFTYEVREGTIEGKQVGWGVDRGRHFFFFNMQEELVLKTLSAILLGKAKEDGEEEEQQVELMEEVQEDDDDAEASSSGCFGFFKKKPNPTPVQQRQSAIGAPGEDIDCVWYIR